MARADSFMAMVVALLGACTFPDLPPLDLDASEASDDADNADDARGQQCEGDRFGFTLSNVPPCMVPVATGAIDLTDIVSIDTTTGVITTRGNMTSALPGNVLMPQSGGPVIRVVSGTSLTVPVGETIRVTGEYPLALLIRGDATITGSMFVGAGRQTCAVGTGTAGTGTTVGGGGGGGALGAAGGIGGHGNSRSDNGGQPGAPLSPPAVAPLRGGCDGSPGSNGTAAGVGGGGLQISVSGVLTINGFVATGGGAGSAQPNGGGGGGGSGGLIVLEAGSQIGGSGTVASNGGGGGGGGGGAGTVPTPGEAGSARAGCSVGGGSGDRTSGYGGNGGCRTSPAAMAGTSGSTGSGGGGGGGAGIIWLRSRLTTFDGVSSPAATSLSL